MTRDDLPSRIVGDVMRRWPATIPVFNRRRMACPGCAMAAFMTVAESARAHGVVVADLAAELAAVLESPDPAAGAFGERA